MFILLLTAVISYLIGSIPTALLLSKYYRNIDIRKIGSGNIGASNAGNILGKKGFAVVSFFDGIVKGTFPILILNLLEFDLTIQVFASICVVMGHNWSIFIKLKGGRGLSTSMGTFLAFWLVPQMITIIIIAFLWGWYIRKNIAPWIMLSFVTAPIIAIVSGMQVELQIHTFTILMLIVIKRLLANNESLPRYQSIIKTFLFRLILDRDISDHDQWITKKK